MLKQPLESSLSFYSICCFVVFVTAQNNNNNPGQKSRKFELLQKYGLSLPLPYLDPLSTDLIILFSLLQPVVSVSIGCVCQTAFTPAMIGRGIEQWKRVSPWQLSLIKTSWKAREGRKITTTLLPLFQFLRLVSIYHLSSEFRSILHRQWSSSALKLWSREVSSHVVNETEI